MPAIAGIAGGLVTAGIGVAGAAGAFAPDSPNSPNYGQITRDAQQAQIDLLPEKIAARMQYDPQVQALQSRLAYQNLFGTEASETEVPTYTVKKVPGQVITVQPGQSAPPGAILVTAGSGNRPSTYRMPDTEVPTLEMKKVATEASPGLLKLLQDASGPLNEIQAQANTSARTAGVRDVFNLGPDILNALRSYDPASTAMADLLQEDAMEGLAAGSELTGKEARKVQQSVRSAQAARGFGFGANDAVGESVASILEGESRKRERQAFAGNVINQRSQLYGDPFRILNISSARNTDPNQFAYQGDSIVPDDIDGGAYSLAGMGYQAQNNAAMAGYNQQMSSIGGLAKGSTDLFGSLLGLWNQGKK